MSPVARYCPTCGAPLATRRLADAPHEPPRQVCTSCGQVHYRNAKPTAAALVLRDGHVLLGRRACPPALGAWDLPGGFLEADEHPTAGVVRELREETGLDITLTGLLGLYLDRYGDEADPDYTLNAVYLAHAPHGEPQAADDVSELAWFPPDDLPATLAFPHLQTVFADWRRQRASEHGGA